MISQCGAQHVTRVQRQGMSTDRQNIRSMKIGITEFKDGARILTGSSEIAVSAHAWYKFVQSSPERLARRRAAFKLQYIAMAIFSRYFIFYSRFHSYFINYSFDIAWMW